MRRIYMCVYDKSFQWFRLLAYMCRFVWQNVRCSAANKNTNDAPPNVNDNHQAFVDGAFFFMQMPT